MSDMFDPIGFTPDAVDPTQIMQALDGAANNLKELNQQMLQRIGQCIEGCMEVEGQLRTRIATPLATNVGMANGTASELGERIRQNINFQLGQADEFEQQLESNIRLGGQAIEIGIPPGAGEPIIEEPEEPEGPPMIMIPPGAGTPIEPEEPAEEPAEEPEDGIAIGGPPEEEENGNGPGGVILPPNGQEEENGEQEEQPPQCPPGTVWNPLTQSCVVVCPPGTVWDSQQQQCVPIRPEQPEPCPVSCPAPVVQCPPPPDITLNVPPCPTVPPGEEEEQQQPGQATPVPEPIGESEGGTFCRIDTYDTASDVDPTGVGLDNQQPIVDFFYGRGTDIDALIAEKEIAASSTLNIARAITRRGEVWWAKLVRRWNQAVTSFAASTGCTNPIFIGAQIWRGVLSFVGIFFSGAVMKLDRILAYRADAYCPVEFPDHNETTEAWVRGTIDEETRDLWLQQNNHCLEPWAKMLESRTDRVEPLMALQMFKREFIPEEEFAKQIRKNGYTDETLQKAWKGLADFIPPITDLIRFMVRDVEDTEIVDKFKLDEDFTEKFKDLLEEWATKQGVSPEVMKRYWRAHWRIPSPEQLYDMFHRTRHLDEGDPLKTTVEDVRLALKQDDMAPGWVERMINRTFRIPTRRDTRRAFETGAIDRETLKRNLMMSGMRDEDAEDITRWAEINKTQVLLNRPVVRLFRDGMIDEGRLRFELEKTKLPAEDINSIIEIATKQGKRKFVNRCVTALRKRFLTGELTIEEVQKELLNVGLNLTQTNAMTGSLLCEQQAKGKQPGTAQLCQWLEMGTIAPQEMVDRLERIGWSNDDAMRILFNCQRKISEKQAREAKKLAEQEQRALEKAQRETEAMRRKLERQREKAERERKKAERAKRNRDKLIQTTIAKFASRSELDLETAGACVHGILRNLQANTMLLIDERISTVVIAVDRLKPKTCAELTTTVDTLADQLLATGQLTDEFLESLVTVS